MKLIIKDNKYFLIPYLILLLIFSAFALTYTKSEMHLWVNRFHAPFFDYFFRNITHLGDRIAVILTGILLLFVRYRYAFALAIGALATSSIVFLFKFILIPDALRPSQYFIEMETFELYLIEGFKLSEVQSFPSGHSASAFNIFFMIAIITSNKYLKMLCFLIALAIAYSRVYLSMHFFIDIAVGSLIAVTFILLAFWWSQQWEQKWLDMSLIKKQNEGHE